MGNDAALWASEGLAVTPEDQGGGWVEKLFQPRIQVRWI